MFYRPGEDATIKELEERTRLNIILYTSVVWVVFVSLFLGVRLYFLQSFDYKQSILVTFVAGFFCLGAYVLKTRNLKKATWVLNALLFIIIPLRACQTGGIYSPGIALYGAHCILAMALLGKQWASWLGAYSVISIFGIAFTGQVIDLPEPSFYVSPINSAFATLFLVALSFMPTFFIFREKDFVLAKLKQTENKKSSSKLIDRLAQRSEESVPRALRLLEKVKDNRSGSEIHQVENQIKNLSVRLKSLSESVEEASGANDREASLLSEGKGLLGFIFAGDQNAVNSSETLSKETRLRVALFCLFVVANVVMFRAVLKSYLFPGSLYNLLSMLVLSAGAWALLAYLWKAKNKTIGFFLFHILFGCITPIRIYLTGGVSSPNVFSLFSYAVVVAAISGGRAAMYAVGYGVFSVILLTFIETFFGVPEMAPESPFFTAFRWCIILIYMTSPVAFLLQLKSRARREISRLEKVESAIVIMRRLNHEIGNKLNIALGFLEIYRDEGEEAHLALVKQKLSEVDSLLKKMQEIAASGKLVELLKENEQEIDIIQKLNLA